MAVAPSASSRRLHFDHVRHLRLISSFHRNLIAMLWTSVQPPCRQKPWEQGRTAVMISVENLAGQWVDELQEVEMLMVT